MPLPNLLPKWEARRSVRQTEFIMEPMPRLSPRLILLAIAVTPFVFINAQTPAAQQTGPTCEQVFKNIQVFKGVPAGDLIPSMEFMAASLKLECTDCHDAKDYSIQTEMKGRAQKMILMQREINEKNFGGRNQVTCMTCHGGKEHPQGTPLPEGISLRHMRMESAPKPKELFAGHIAAAGNSPTPLVRTGTLTAPNDVTHKVETVALELVQAPGGKYRLTSGDRKIGSNGTDVWYGATPVSGEPAFLFNRMGRTWLGADAFGGLESPTVVGQEKIGKDVDVVVRASRPTTSSTQELIFSPKSHLLQRLVNARRSSLGTVVTAIDYSNYKKVGGILTPMKVVLSFGGGEQWVMDFKSAKLDPSITDSAFKMGP